MKKSVMKKKSVKMRNWCVLGFALCIALTCAVSVGAGLREKNARKVQSAIAEKIIRFHVVADSDNEEDQRVKLQVKEAVVRTMEPLLSHVSSVEEARQVIQLHMGEIQRTANDTLAREGSDDRAQAQLTHCYFPVKTYGQYTFPDGEYEALRITIGTGEGKNWWCVMYPRLCFVDSLYSVVPETSSRELKNNLSDKEYKAIVSGQRKVKVKWKLLELLGL